MKSSCTFTFFSLAEPQFFHLFVPETRDACREGSGMEWSEESESNRMETRSDVKVGTV